MPTYVLPQVLVYQDFNTAPSAVANALQAHIAGPNGVLVRYAQTSEREQGFLGYYDSLNAEVYAWPNRPAGGIIDQTYTKIWIQNALLEYLNDNTTCASSGTNAIVSDALSFGSGGSGFPISASLGDRGVQVGDIVQASFATSPATVLWTYVAGLAAASVASSISVSTADAGNAGTTTASATSTQISGSYNAISFNVSNSAAYTSYDPYPTGRTTETYTVTVTQSSVGGNLTTARLQITSASGLDNVASVTPNADGQYTPIGTHGFKAIIDAHGSGASESAHLENISPDDLIAGQKWRLTVTAAHTATTSTSNSGNNNGVYSGTATTTYIATVVTGGKFATTTPQIQVTTTTGYDVSGPTNVTAAGVNVAIGTKGLTLRFAGLGLALGDRYYITATAAGTGAINKIILGHNIPATVTNGTACTLQLYILEPLIQLSQNRLNEAPLTNFDQSPTQLTVHYGATWTEPSWTFSGVSSPLPIVSNVGQNYGRLYVETRTWVSTAANDVNAINDVANITNIPGQLDPDNPLAWAMFKALTNSNGTNVTYTAVEDPTQIADWEAVLSLLEGRSDVYGLVPLTNDPTIQSLWQAHVDDSSSPTVGAYRVCWLNLSDVPTIPVVSTGSAISGYTGATTTNGNPALATILDDPNTTGTQYTLVTVPAGNAAFITNGVQPGDIVRAFFTSDGFGNTTWQEFVVDRVVTNDSLLLLAGPSVAVNVAAKIEVWRNLNATDEAAAIAKIAGAFADRRVRAVWPDTISDGGTSMPGYHLCAALSGLSAGILPQQGMTNLAIAGFDDVSRTTKKFNKTQLDAMAVSGVWIVTQAPTGEVYTRQALTTGLYTDINQREEMVTRNVDSISFQFIQLFAPYIGVANVTPATIDLMNLEAQGLIQQLQVAGATPTLGGQLVDAKITSIQQSAVLLDRIVCYITLTLPYSLNDFELHLVV